MPDPTPAAQAALVRLLASEHHARARVSEAEARSRARLEGARDAGEELVARARADAEADADRRRRELLAATAHDIAVEDERSEAEIAAADAAADRSLEVAVRRVVRWVLDAES
jgi:vacuolar-type H+-ATPase subunit H